MKKSYAWLKKLSRGNTSDKGLLCFMMHFDNILPDKARCSDCSDYKDKSCLGRGFSSSGVKDCMMGKIQAGDMEFIFKDGNVLSVDLGSTNKKLIVNA